MHTGALSASLDGPTQVAIYMGLLNPSSNSSASISVDCSTGNCTFPADAGATFSTLAMCHSCTDISNAVSVNATTIPTNYTMKSGAWVGRERLVATVDADSADEESMFAFDALMLNYPDNCTAADQPETSQGCRPTEPFAVRCALRPCLQTYGANVTESVYSETLVSTEELPYVVDNGYFWTLAANRTLEDGTWRSCNATARTTASNTVGVGKNGTLWGTKPEGSTTTTYYPDSCVWAFNYTAALAQREFLTDLFHDNFLQFYDLPSAIMGDLWLQNLYRNGSATLGSAEAYMQALAVSMTANVRTRGETPGGGYATGTPLASRTCIRVRWAWFALPGALLVLTAGFLTTLLLQSTLQADKLLWWQQGTWKSSSFVSLFHGFDKSTFEKLRGGVDTGGDASPPAVSGKEMEDIAQQMRVQLCEDESGLKFVEAFADDRGTESFDQPELALNESSAQRGSLLASDPDASVASHTPRPQSQISWRSVSPPA